MQESDVVDLIEGLTARQLRLWVGKGWVRPSGGQTGPEFDELDLARIRLIRQLRHDMKVNIEALPIVLSLIDQVYDLRRELRNLALAVEAQPGHIKSEIATAYRDRLDQGGAKQ